MITHHSSADAVAAIQYLVYMAKRMLVKREMIKGYKSDSDDHTNQKFEQKREKSNS